MADPEDIPDENYEQFMENQRQSIMMQNENDPVALIEKIYQLWWNWADFQLFIISPTIEGVIPPIIIPPEPLQNSQELEFVYPIHDHGYKLATSKGENMYSVGKSMCKLYFTIEKMISLLVDRLNSGGVDKETEVQVAFAGHELAQRKAFESIINLSYNVVVTNFDPGSWGQHYLQVVKGFSDKGFGYLPSAPRDNYRQSHSGSQTAKKNNVSRQK